MLPNVNRLKKKKDFEKIFKSAKSFKNDFFILKAVKNNLGLNRFGFVVSQKVSKKATFRNKVRRRLTEAIKSEAKNIKTGTDLIIIALSGIEKRDFPDIKKSMNNALNKAKLVII